MLTIGFDFDVVSGLRRTTLAGGTDHHEVPKATKTRMSFVNLRELRDKGTVPLGCTSKRKSRWPGRPRVEQGAGSSRRSARSPRKRSTPGAGIGLSRVRLTANESRRRPQ